MLGRFTGLLLIDYKKIPKNLISGKKIKYLDHYQKLKMKKYEICLRYALSILI